MKHCGENVIIGKTVRIRQPHLVSIGDDSIIDDFTYISCALEVGRNCHIASNVNISGGAGKLTIGNFSTLSSHVSVHCGSSDYRMLSMDLPSAPKDLRFGGVVEDINIEDLVTVGAHSCILPGSFLPRGSAFGAYTLVKKKKLDEFHLYAGIRCSDMGLRDLKELERLNKIFDLSS